jgi:hypothetical protein
LEVPPQDCHHPNPGHRRRIHKTLSNKSASLRKRIIIRQAMSIKIMVNKSSMMMMSELCDLLLREDRLQYDDQSTEIQCDNQTLLTHKNI